MFAVLVFEREFLQAKDLPVAVWEWIQDAGGIAAVGLAIWVIAQILSRRTGQLLAPLSAIGFSRKTSGEKQLSTVRDKAASSRPSHSKKKRRGKGAAGARSNPSSSTPLPQGERGGPASQRSLLTVLVFFFATILAGTAYLLVAILKIVELAGGSGGAAGTPGSTSLQNVQSVLLLLGGGSAIVAVLTPLAADLRRLSWRRIEALARLTFMEVVRLRVLWVFLALLLVFLFPPKWFFTIQAEHEVRSSVQSVYKTTIILLWWTFVLLASFGIPGDVRQQTIHTIVTKPVERFEIGLGRFFGYVSLMTVVLAVLTGFSLFFILGTSVSPEAARESFHARVPLYANELKFFQGGVEQVRGFNVGKEWHYRSYIPGPSPQRPRYQAVWNYRQVPKSLGVRKSVGCEFSFDVQRMTRGPEARGVNCSITFLSPNAAVTSEGDPVPPAGYEQERKKLLDQRDPDIDGKLANKYGFYQIKAVPIEHGRTQAVVVPGEVFRDQDLRVHVRCEDPAQFIGMARHDLYIRLDSQGAEPSAWLFAWNFAKGMIGIWFRICLAIGVAVSLSSYLSGVITLLSVGFIYLGGIARSFILDIIERRTWGGGPTESFYRLVTHQGGTPLDQNASAFVMTGFDEGFRRFMRFTLSIFPDVERFDLTALVAGGFDISWTGNIFIDNFIPFIGYVLPWLVGVYYLLRWREVANP